MVDEIRKTKKGVVIAGRYWDSNNQRYFRKWVDAKKWTNKTGLEWRHYDVADDYNGKVSVGSFIAYLLEYEYL